MMQIEPGWHPFVVHFPLALIVTAAVALTVSRLVSGERPSVFLATCGTGNLLLGSIAIYVALGTGLAAVIDLHVDAAAHASISLHVKSAVVTTLLVTLAAVWRVAGVAPGSRPSRAFLMIFWAATLAMLITGYRGAQNVYRHGIGVAMQPSSCCVAR